MHLFDDLGRPKADAATEAYAMACRALDAVSTASRPEVRQAYEAAIATAIRRAVAAGQGDRESLTKVAIAQVVSGPKL